MVLGGREPSYQVQSLFSSSNHQQQYLPQPWPAMNHGMLCNASREVTMQAQMPISLELHMLLKHAFSY